MSCKSKSSGGCTFSNQLLSPCWIVQSFLSVADESRSMRTSTGPPLKDPDATGPQF